MSKTDTLMQEFLIKLNSVEVQEAFKLLGSILEGLENKNDPEPFEMDVVSNSYQVLEKLSILKVILTEQLSKSETLKGTKLQNLYDKGSIEIGSQVFFD